MMLRLFFNAETQRRRDREEGGRKKEREIINAETQRRGDTESKRRTLNTEHRTPKFAPFAVLRSAFSVQRSAFSSSLSSSFLLPPFSLSLRPLRGRHSLLLSPLRPLGGRNKAFTLIETALAMLAIGLGLLAIFGLGRLSLQAAKETEHDQRCAMMADAVFETLRDYNARFVDEARTNNVPGTWKNLWNQALQNEFDIPFPPIAGMSASPKILLRFTGPDSFAAAFDKDNLSLTDWNPLYSLSGNFLNPPGPGPSTALHITLVIHPDGYTYSSDQRLFRTTLTNPGGLP